MRTARLACGLLAPILLAVALSGCVRQPAPEPASAPVRPVSAPAPVAAAPQPPAAPKPLLLARIKTDRPLVALTFDCCQTSQPAGYDARLVRVLVSHRTPATFFLGGRWMETHPHETQYLASIPYFELGNHSYIHAHMKRLSSADQSADLERTQKIMFRLVGRRAAVFRPPYGEYNESLIAAAARAGMATVTWDIETGDPDRHATVADLMGEFRKARPGSIVVMHANGRGWRTADALPQMLSYLAAKHLSSATVSSLMSQGRPTAPGPINE